MATIVFGAVNGNWSDDTKWVGGVKPTAADDAQLVLASANCTIDAAVCRSLDCNTYVGVLTHNSGVTLTIGDGTAGAGNIALRLVAGMTYTKGSNTTSAILLASTSATQQSIYCGSKTLGDVTINCPSNGSYILQDAFLSNGGANFFILTLGSLNTNGQTVGLNTLSSFNSNVRSLTLGTSVVTCNTTVVINSSNLTFSGASSTINIGGASATFTGGSLTYGTVNLTGSGSQTLAGVNTFGALTRTGTAVKTDGLLLAASQTVTGTFTVTGNSKTNRVYVRSDTKGTARTITAAATSINGADFQDITGAGAASWDMSGASDYTGDAGGNTMQALGAAAFTTAATQTATGTASFMWSTHGWSGAGGADRAPLCQDDVVVNNAFIAGRTVTMDMPRAGKSITFAGCANTPAFTAGSAWSFFGSLNLTGLGTITTGAVTAEGRGSYTLTCGGKSITNQFLVDAPGGTLTMQDAFAATSNMTVNSGTFVDGGYSGSCNAFVCSGTATRAVTISGSWTVSGTSTVWNAATTTNLTFTATGSTIIVSNVAANAKTFTGAGLTYGHLTVSGDNVTIGGSNTFATLAVNTAGLTNGLFFTTGTTQTVTGVTTNGSAGNLAKWASTTATAATLSCTNPISLDYLSLTKIVGAGAGIPFYAGANSTDGGGNTNWTFTTPPGGFLASRPFIPRQAIQRASSF